jgi:hypothetical protein
MGFEEKLRQIRNVSQHKGCHGGVKAAFFKGRIHRAALNKRDD